MRDFTGKRYWLVGASEGLGLALAQKLSAAGAEVILSARSPDKLAEAVALMPGRAIALPCDVASTASVRDAAEQAGDIDGVVFLAGVYWPMKAQDWDAGAVETMCDINLTGCARVMGAVVPQMVKRGRGHIVITGSLSGFRGLPGAIGYCASKAGTMSLAESMHCDLRGTGIDVQLSNPGFIKTRLTDKNDFSMPQIMEPGQAAQHMFDHMLTDRFSDSFPVPFAWVFRLSQFLPDWAYYRLFAPK
ncbi:MAG: short-chain dehydrogenase [Rhodobacter sp. CACIA14H1]|nr:MAG: short-chain dehydrogenase [Rhodobacter sp. CACIA14H1]